MSICLSPTTENPSEDNSVWRHCGKEGRRFNKMSLRQFLCRSLPQKKNKDRFRHKSSGSARDFCRRDGNKIFSQVKNKKIYWWPAYCDLRCQNPTFRSNLLTYVNANFRLQFQSSVDLKGWKDFRAMEWSKFFCKLTIVVEGIIIGFSKPNHCNALSRNELPGSYDIYLFVFLLSMNIRLCFLYRYSVFLGATNSG